MAEIKIFDYFVLAFALIGILTISAFAHEYYHFQDIKKQGAEVKDFAVYCFGECETTNSLKSAGWVTYYKSRTDIIGSELKAYLFQAIILILLVIILFKSNLLKNAGISLKRH